MKSSAPPCFKILCIVLFKMISIFWGGGGGGNPALNRQIFYYIKIFPHLYMIIVPFSMPHRIFLYILITKLYFGLELHVHTCSQCPVLYMC